MSKKYRSTRIAAVLALSVGLVGFLASSRARADEWDKLTRLTVNQPIQVQDKLLEPGQYVFKLADSNSDRHIVQIFNSDQSQIIDTILAMPNYRLRPTGNSRFAFYETPPGAAKALRAWFYPGDNFGQEFRYPKHLAMLTKTETMAPPAAPAPEPPQEEATPAPAPEPAPAPAPAPEQSMTQPAQQEPQTQIAQNNPTAETPAPVQEAQAQPAPEQLPKTASPYPLFGFGGLFFFGLYSLLRLRRMA